MINYDPHLWLDHLFDIKGSMFKEIVGRISLSGIWAVGVVAFHYYVRPIATPSTVHSLVGVALGLLLVFRTNASYDRFWEGRKAWGGIVNETRNLARLGKTFLREDAALYSKLIHWTIAFAYGTMNHLRNRASFGPVEELLPENERNNALQSEHAALSAAIQISLILNEARKKNLISDYLQVSLDQNVQLLVDYLGMCERIRKTPLPFAYVVHLRRALILYCATLPFALVESFGWSTVLATLFISFVFFGIEEIGVEIEDPFGHDENDIPLEKICETIEKNLLGLKQLKL